MKDLKIKTEEEVYEYISRKENIGKYFVWKAEEEDFASIYIVERKKLK